MKSASIWVLLFAIYCCLNSVNTLSMNVEKVVDDDDDDDDDDYVKEENAHALLTIGTATGGVSFGWNYTENCMSIKGTIKNLTPGLHGFHIHELGDLRGGCKSTAGHYNPDGATHAGPTDVTHHVGDLGNIKADADGVANIDLCYDFVHTTGDQSVLGRAIVVHATTDDLGTVDNDGSRATGNAGGRVGCGIIGLTR